MTDPATIPRVHAAVVAAWRPFVSDARARAEADGFVRRVFAPANENAADGYDDLLLRVASAIAEDAPPCAISLCLAALKLREA